MTLGKFFHLQGLVFLSCKCHATFVLIAAIFIEKGALGNLIKDRLPASYPGEGTLMLRSREHLGSPLAPLMLISSSFSPTPLFCIRAQHGRLHLKLLSKRHKHESWLGCLCVDLGLIHLKRPNSSLGTDLQRCH